MTNYRFSAVDRDSGYTGVKAKWHDMTSGETLYELIGEKGRSRRLRPTHPSQAEAIAAAQAEWSRLQRRKNNHSIQPLVKHPPEIDTGSWLVSQLRHTLVDGMTTMCELEARE